MTTVRCTTKLLKLMVAPVLVEERAPSGDDWYANLLWLERRKCLLLTHSATLFSLLEPDVRKAAANPLGPFAVKLIERELRGEGLAANALGALKAADFIIGRTQSRSVLGTMNDMRYQIEAAVDEAGGLRQLDLPRLNRSLRRIPFSAIGYERPIDRVRARVVAPSGGPVAS